MKKLLCRIGIHRPLFGHRTSFVDTVSGKMLFVASCPCGKKWAGRVIENCADFIDVTSPVGEAWEVVQEEIARLKKELEAQRGELKNALNRIANYAPQGDLSEEDKKLLIKRDEVLEIKHEHKDLLWNEIR